MRKRFATEIAGIGADRVASKGTIVEPVDGTVGGRFDESGIAMQATLAEIVRPARTDGSRASRSGRGPSR